LDKKENSQKEEKPTGQAKKTKKQQREKKTGHPFSSRSGSPTARGPFLERPGNFSGPQSHFTLLFWGLFGNLSGPSSNEKYVSGKKRGNLCGRRKAQENTLP